MVAQTEDARHVAVVKTGTSHGGDGCKLEVRDCRTAELHGVSTETALH